VDDDDVQPDDDDAADDDDQADDDDVQPDDDDQADDDDAADDDDQADDDDGDDDDTSTGGPGGVVYACDCGASVSPRRDAGLLALGLLLLGAGRRRRGGSGE